MTRELRNLYEVVGENDDPRIGPRCWPPSGVCRHACNEAIGRAPIRDEIARRAEALKTAIGDVAEVLTGDREHFWLKPYGGPKL